MAPFLPPLFSSAVPHPLPIDRDPRRRWVRSIISVVAAGVVGIGLNAVVHAADFNTLVPLLQQYCVECHGTQEPEGGLSLESYEDLLKGGESGPALVAGNSGESRLVRALAGAWGKTGKNQFMPPGKREHLKPEQIAAFKAWIDAGAPKPAATAVVAPAELVVPRITPKTPPPRAIHDLAFDARSGLLAVARPDGVELLQPETRAVVRTLAGAQGPVNAVAFSTDGQFVFAAAGWPNQGGEVRQWRAATGESVRTFSGPKDAVHSLAVRADGTLLAAGSYDYSVTVWRVADGTVQRTLAAHQGAVMGLAFRPDGRFLASASYDRTLKLLDPISGARLETLGQALKELNALAFSPDGTVLLSGGNDNRIRSYRVSADGKEGSNELLATVFAHEGALLRLAYSPDGQSVASSADDRTVKLFSAPALQQRATLEIQPDWPTALTFAGNDRVAVGRADGSLALYQARDGQPWTPPPPPKPVLSQVEPRGMQRGVETTFQLSGQHLTGSTVVSVFTDHLLATLAPTVTNGIVTFPLTLPADQPRGPLEFTVSTPAGESGRSKVWIDDLPQTTNTQLRLPTAAWGVLGHRGATAEYRFNATAGETLLLDLEAQSLGLLGDYTLTLLDAQQRTLARNDAYAGQLDPLIVHQFAAAGEYRVVVGEATYGGSPEHRFRLTVGALPLVTSVFPMTLPANATNELIATGYNLPGEGRQTLITGADVSQTWPLPDGWRTRRDWKLDVTPLPTSREQELNNALAQAQSVPVPAVVTGRIDPAGDVDVYRFSVEAGRTYVLETMAARRGSTADTRLEILWPDGRPVERLRLQAVRNSAVTFRPEDSNDSGIRFDNWEEMELNDYLYCGGEVMKLFRAPQGPDSDSVLYTANGRRRAWFDTTATAHYLDEPVYVVTPLAPGTAPVANGLPVFTVNHLNDDAGRRDAGRDSRLHFTAPVTGDFLVRVDDPRRLGDPTATYALTLRLAEPDFAVRLNGAPGAVTRGSGQSFSLSVERRDGFEDAVTLEFLHLPTGWTVTGPVTIEAGHETATLTLNADADATQPDDVAWDAVRVVASSRHDGRTTVLAVNTLGRPKLLTETPKLRVALESVEASTKGVVVIRPGGTARARLKIERNGFDGVVVFNVDNLPHGVIVENLGLNGITFLANESEREISFSAVPWVPDLDRPFHAVENQAGRQTSRPLLLQVRRPTAQAAK